MVGFDEGLDGADAVVIGEGCLDEQTLHGKAPAVVAARARVAGVPVLAVAGRVTLSPDQLEAAGIRAALAVTEAAPSLEDATASPDRWLEVLGHRLAQRLPR